MKIAEFINNYPERNKLKIMFMRESEGVYEFGSKRIYVMIHKGSIKISIMFWPNHEWVHDIETLLIMNCSFYVNCNPNAPKN